MNFEQARFNMIEQQIRPWEVLDQRVLDVIGRVPREDFVPEGFRQLAFSDTCIPLGHGEVMMQPKVEARLLQALSIEPEDQILEIGTGSGYLTALLALLGSRVTSVDIHKDFSAEASLALARHDLNNIQLEVGDGVRGWRRAGPCDVIAVTGSLPVLDACFEQQLAIGGRMFVIVGRSPVMEALLITRVSEHQWSRESLFETDLPPLVGAPKPSSFVF